MVSCDWAIPENIHTIPQTVFRNSKGRGWGSLNWISEGKGGCLWLEFQRHGGFKIWNLHKGQTRVYSMKMFINFYGINQFANKAQTDDAADNYRSRIQDKHRSISCMCSYSFAQVNQQNMGCKSLSRGLNPLMIAMGIFIPYGMMKIFLPGPIKLLINW